MDEMKKFYVGVKGIIVDAEKGALLLRHNNGFWNTPGGRINGDESIDQTLIRELNEELPGIQNIEKGKLLDACRIHKDIVPDTSLVLVYFLVTAKLPEPLKISDEHVSFLWVKTRADIPEDLEEQVVKIFKDILPA
ncbi:MAG: mutT [Candidatus Saccharibacteria bacterium]|nr:mutT [Candidatus Saccharibacteria bacterium]